MSTISTNISDPLFESCNTNMCADFVIHTLMKTNLVKSASLEDAKELFLQFVNPEYEPCKIVAGITKDAQIDKFIDKHDTNFVLVQNSSCSINASWFYKNIVLLSEGDINIQNLVVVETLIVVGKKIDLSKAKIHARRIVIIGEQLIGYDTSNLKSESTCTYIYDYQIDTYLPTVLALVYTWIDMLALDKQLMVIENGNVRQFYVQDLISDIVQSYVKYDKIEKNPAKVDLMCVFSEMFPNTNPEVLQEIVNNAIDKCNNENSNEKPLPAGTNFEQLVVNNIQPVFVQGGAADNSPTIVGEDDVQ